MQPTIWCRVKFHKWTRWQVVGKGRAKTYGDFTNVEYEEIRRECICCGVPQKKVVWEILK